MKAASLHVSHQMSEPFSVPFRLEKALAELPDKPDIEHDVDGYFKQMRLFLEDTCLQPSDSLDLKTDFRERSSTLFKAYQQWCIVTDKNPVTMNRFGRTLKKLLLSTKDKGCVVYKGVKLRKDKKPE